MIIKTKLSIKDSVWLILRDEVLNTTIEQINISVKKDFHTNENIISIQYGIYYTTDEISEISDFFDFSEEWANGKVFKTKEELINSL